MSNKKIFILGIILLSSIFLILFLQSSFVSSQEVSYCCEKTVSGGPGGWCVNANQSQCDPNFRKVPTSCESTSYCKKGTCVNRVDGICLENTPRVKCEEKIDGKAIGVWYDSPSDDVPLCKLGCCLIGDQAAFVTQTRCQKLSSNYGLEINFRADIQNEIQCIASATPEAKGACVFETETGRTCKFITKKECQEMKSGNPSAEFHENFLCTNPSLGADCGMTRQTTCVEGRDEVYFVDSCGNLANVYRADKVSNTEYWSKILPPDCGDERGSAGSVTCGDCNYFLGSTCKPYDRSIDGAKTGLIGNNICRDLGCKYENKEYEHGETWCTNGENPGVTGDDFSEFEKTGNKPGSRDFRLVCYNGEVTVEPCADYRQEICLQSEVGLEKGKFRYAACRANLWRDCYAQDNKQDCENIEKRDCKWVKGVSILKDENGESLAKDENGNKIEASCVPKYSPGFDFWKEGTDAGNICQLASTTCVVRYEKSLTGDWKIVESREGLWGKIMEFIGGPSKKVEEEELICLDNEKNLIKSWTKKIENSCSALGDCGVSKNYIGKEGYYKEAEATNDLFTVIEGEEKKES